MTSLSKGFSATTCRLLWVEISHLYSSTYCDADCSCICKAHCKLYFEHSHATFLHAKFLIA